MNEIPAYSGAIVASPNTSSEWIRASPSIAASIVDFLKDEFNIGKVYIGGHSAGSYYAYSVGASSAIPNLAGILPIAGNGRRGVRPGVAVSHLHGTRDRINSYSGGVRSVERSAQDNDCTGSSESRDIDDITTRTFENCRAPVRLYTCRGAGHFPCQRHVKQIFQELLDDTN